MYPDLVFLKFLEASVLVAAGNRGLAVQVLENALTEYPDNEEGRELYRALTKKQWVDKKKSGGN